MGELYEVLFSQNKHTIPYGGFQAAMEGWIRLYRNQIKVVRAGYLKVESEEDPNIYVDAICIGYEADSELPSIKQCLHNATAETVVNPSCTQEGSRITYCQNCGIVLKREIIPVLPHTPVEKETVPSTCTMHGHQTIMCSRCHQILSSKMLPLGEHHLIESVEQEPTCTTPGYKIKQCRVCGMHAEAESIPALSHAWVSNQNGTHQCSRCHVSETCHPNDYGDICTTCGYQTPDDATLSFIVGSIPNFVMEQEMSYQLPSSPSTGVSFQIAEGQLSDGITMSSTGLISGTPTGYGSYPITIEATYHNQKVSQAITITILDNVTLSIVTAVLNNGTIHKPYASCTVQANIANELCTWALISGQLPTGLQFDPNTATISGTATQSGSFTFTIQASYHAQTVSKQFSIYIDEGPCTVTFNPTTGTVAERTRQVNKGSMIGELPVPTPSGELEFVGWYTSEIGGLKVDPTYSVSADITLYARWGDSSDINFGEAITTFNIHIDGDRTNYNDSAYTLYARVAGGGSGNANLVFQTGISSQDGTNNMSATNQEVVLYLKVTNTGEAGSFDIGFDCDSYVSGDDKVLIERIANGVRLASKFTVTSTNAVAAWIGKYNDRTNNRYVDVPVGTKVGTGTSNDIDTGYAFTIKDIFINSGAYTILPVTFKRN